MFANFNKVFNNKPQTQIPVPTALVDYLSKSLPDGVKYTLDDKGNCIIAAENKQLLIEGFIFKPNKEQKKILGKNFSHKDVMNYVYNSQKPIALELKKEGYITINGEELPISKMAFNPLNPIEYISGTFFMSPPKFPDPFSITVSCDRYQRNIIISRVPNNSINIIAYQSENNSPLFIEYFIDTSNDNIKMNIELKLIHAKTIRDLVESAIIYNAFLDGKGLLMGTPLDAIIDNINANRFDEKSAIFWEKVLKVEEILNTNFIPPQEDVDSQTMYLVEQLYQSLVNKVPTRDTEVITSVDGTWNFKNTETDINTNIGHPIFLEFEITKRFNLFGTQQELPALLGVFNAILSEYQENGKKQKITIADESPQKTRYMSIMYFKTDEDLKEYKANDHQKRIEILKNAKKPQDYLAT